MLETRVYPVKDPETVARLQQDYSAKLKRNKEAGLQAFQRSEYNPFLGWSEKAMRNVFNVILELDDASKQRVMKQVVNPLQELAQIHSIPAIFAGNRDLPPHVTLQVGIIKDISVEQFQDIQRWLTSNKSHLNALARILEGLEFKQDTLVIAPNSYICASEFGNEQGAAFKSRRIIERMMGRSLRLTSGEQVGGSFAPPYSYYDIFHTSVLRLTDHAPAENLSAFAEEAYGTIGENLKRNPLEVKVAHLFRGIAADFMRTYTPHLLLP